jgi:long-chain acyl-CoA synthetase
MAYPRCFNGVLIAGGGRVNVNPLYTARELTQQLNDSGARILFVLENFGYTVAEALPR